MPSTVNKNYLQMTVPPRLNPRNNIVIPNTTTLEFSNKILSAPRSVHQATWSLHGTGGVSVYGYGFISCDSSSPAHSLGVGEPIGTLLISWYVRTLLVCVRSRKETKPNQTKNELASHYYWLGAFADIVSRDRFPGDQHGRPLVHQNVGALI